MTITIIKIPNRARLVLATLENHGYPSYLAGGIVRDSIIGRVSHDIDIVTAALPEQVTALFPHHVPDGKAQGVIKAIFDIDGDSEVVDIATMRKDGEYLDGRRPDGVEFTTNLEDDVKRRDFTINALFADKEGNVIDLVDGLKDIKAHVVRCVGNPNTRFQEDHLRMLRAIRFGCQLNFEIHPDTLEAIVTNHKLLAVISQERIWQELWKIMESPLTLDGVKLLIMTGLMQNVLPEVINCHAIKQDPIHHPEGDVLIHSLDVLNTLASAEPLTKLAGLLHDIGKCTTSSARVEDFVYRISHIDHENTGAVLAEQALRRLTCPSDIRDKIVWLVKNHMRAHKVKEMKKSKLMSFLREAVEQNTLTSMIALQHADSNHDSSKDCFDFFKEILAQPLLVKKVAEPGFVNGDDLITLGLPQGKKIGIVLATLREAQDEGIVEDRESALKYARQLVEEQTR